MAYHVPFNQRPRRGRPVYIGFDEPSPMRRRRGRFNWFGFTGLMLALASPFTLFMLAPLALLFSLIGLRRSPRGMAAFGTVFALIGTTLLSTGIYAISARSIAESKHREHVMMMHRERENIAETRQTLADAKEMLTEYRNENKFYLPDKYEAAAMTVEMLDAWNESLRYEVITNGCMIRSSGPDRLFDTNDDLTVKIDGKTDEQTFLDL